jgi:hypothetical protein
VLHNIWRQFEVREFYFSKFSTGGNRLEQIIILNKGEPAFLKYALILAKSSRIVDFFPEPC